jgi:predicted nucleic acid-binding protein
MNPSHPRISLDTNAIIYFAEAHPVFGRPAALIIEGAARSELTIVTSELSLAEVLVLPYKLGQRELIDRYAKLLTTHLNFEVHPVSREILTGCAKLRASAKIKTPDAIHVSTALVAGCSHLVTEDNFEVPPPVIKVLVSNAIETLQLKSLQ